MEIPELSYCRMKGHQMCKVKNILDGDLKRVLLNITMSKVCVHDEAHGESFLNPVGLEM